MSKEYIMGEFQLNIAGVSIGVATALIGGWHITLQILLILMVADVVTGLIKGMYQSNFSSSAFRKGLLSKAGFFIVLILCHQIDLLAGNSEPIVRGVGAIFYIAVEGTSIVENLGAIGVPIPSAIKKRLEKLRDSEEDEEE